MTTSRTGDLQEGTPHPPARRDGARGLRRAGTVALLLLASLPALAGLAELWLHRGEPYLPFGDHAILALVVDDVGQHEVLLGAYSRFGWFHPGPMGTYLLAATSFVLGGALQALSAGTLVLNGLSAAVTVWLVRRRAGLAPALWTLLVLTLSVQILGEEFLRDSWNPFLPVLPFLAGVLLCWTALLGDAWALPLAAIPLSLAVQSHVGFAPAVGAVGAVLAAGLALRAVRRLRSRRVDPEEPARRPRRWVLASAGAAAVTALLWLPTAIQQGTGSPGNAGVLLEDLVRGSSEAPAGVGTGLRAVADEFGKLPASVVGAGRPAAPFLPERWPALAVAVGLVAFAVTIGLAVRRRRVPVLCLGALTAAVAAAGVAAIARIDGPPYPYLAQWTVVIGVLVWTTVGLGLLPGGATGIRSVPRAETVLTASLAVLTAGVVLAAAVGTARADTPSTDRTGQLVRLEQAVVTDLDRLGLRTGPDRAVVRVDFAPTSRADDLVGTLWPGTGLLLGLVRNGVDVQVLEFWRTPFGERYTERVADAGYVATLAFTDGTSPPPEPWQQVLEVDGELQVYGGVPPAG